MRMLQFDGGFGLCCSGICMGTRFAMRMLQFNGFLGKRKDRHKAHGNSQTRCYQMVSFHGLFFLIRSRLCVGLRDAIFRV